MEKNALRKIKFKSLIEEWLQYKKTTIKGGVNELN